ncbi:zf-CCCH domain-containing protein [Cephalotus follicularis]|uniref:Zf-CCCH domain-containing protein n=1 Tax=Cephalotus follicularis TaxID=3775 RepID=A0A1Q3CSC8_CEPFO|nr:zf-CCCH domain-containing protein [Cephalotus follicularis]
MMQQYNRKQLCRNFQRGSCQYGERCKFVHSNATQSQRSAATNQHPNPFGFGVQTNSLPNAFPNKQHHHQQFKPGENKWSRFSPTPTPAAPSSRQPDNQAQSSNHTCTDPVSCKRIIAEDFENERPLWKLTCYTHRRNAICDIVGDIGFEELRAVAYDDAKHGLSLQSVVEKERNLLHSKLMEFDNLLRNPYRGPLNSASASQSPFPGSAPNAFSVTPQNIAPPSVSGFSQLGTSPNTGFGTRSFVPSNNAFGQPNSFTNNLPSANASFSNSGVVSVPSNQISAFAVSTPNPSSYSNQAPMLLSGPIPSTIAVERATMNIKSVENFQSKPASADVSIWLKEKWMPGEIPEEAPPDAFV